MVSRMRCCGWVSRLSLFTVAVSLALTGCATTTVVSAPATSTTVASDEDDFSHLIAQLRSDLNRQIKREADRQP